jgi:hypothetical protein
MVQTFSDDTGTYSVDMMFAYVNLFKPEPVAIRVDDFKRTLSFKGWDDERGRRFSANDVLRDPGKYPGDAKRIEEADLKYPVLVAKGFIVDGVHRLAKATRQGRENLKAHVFDRGTLRKFKIKDDKLDIHEYIALFHKRFCRK